MDGAPLMVLMRAKGKNKNNRRYFTRRLRDAWSASLRMAKQFGLLRMTSCVVG
jgi:hypothetical protein